MATVMTGARAIFSLGGVQVAFASNVSYNELKETETKPF